MSLRPDTITMTHDNIRPVAFATSIARRVTLSSRGEQR
jgi:hypothetical protein